MKTAPMKQQQEALRRMNGKAWYALFMEQGTGKTWSFLADGERYYAGGKIDGLFVVAPNGVHTNWIKREIPTHLSDPYIAYAWYPSMSKRKRALMERDLLTPHEPGQQRPFRIFAINYESLARSKDAFEFCKKFLRAVRSIYILDESQKIKNPSALTTKQVMKLKPLAPARRIGTGTPMDKPEDIFSQMEFLEEGLLGTPSYRAFMSEFAVVCDPKNPVTSDDWALKRRMESNPRLAWAIVVAKDEETGRPMYRNLDKLARLIEPHSYRVLKKECMDLPPKVYTTHYFELSAAQRKAYILLEDQLRVEASDGTLTRVSALSKFMKLQQITSGYVMVPGEEQPKFIGEDNPRIEAVAQRMELVDGRIILWCKFREELKAVAASLRAKGYRVVEYHGDVKQADRDAAIDAIQAGEADVFLGIQKAGGTGLTLTGAETTGYVSNEHSAIARLQSEDRNHRKGTVNSILYIDFAAVDTIDESITYAHQWKTDLAGTILRDRQIDLRGIFTE